MKSKKFASAATEARRSCSTAQCPHAPTTQNSHCIAFCATMMSRQNMITGQKPLQSKATAPRLIGKSFAQRLARPSQKPKLGMKGTGTLSTFCPVRSTKGRISWAETTKSLPSLAMMLTNISPKRLRDFCKKIMSSSFRKESPNTKHMLPHTLS